MRPRVLLDTTRQRPDLLLLGMAMPVMSGPELLDELEERGMLPELPVVVVSANSQRVEARRARAFLRKPPSMEQLFATIGALCRQ